MFDRRKFMQKLVYLLAIAHIPVPKVLARETLDQRPVIIRIHSSKASIPWDFEASSPWDHTAEPRSLADMKSLKFRKDRYFDNIDQETVKRMVDLGVQSITQTHTPSAAWRKILAQFNENHRITIKINLNNASYNEKITTNRMDQSVQMVNALVNSLTSSLNIPEENITVADPSRWIHPLIMKEKCAFQNIKWVDSRSDDLWDHKESVVFSAHQPIRPDRPGFPEKVNFYMPRIYTEANHIINVCLLKNHGCGITGAMKNHFGAIPPRTPKYLHDGLGSKSYIADVCNTPSIKNKVRLNVCEAIFGNWHNNVWSPRPWKTFPDNTPNSLFFGTDPVAFDSVLLEHIIDEVTLRGDEVDQWVQDAVKDHDFLSYAMNTLALGIHEHKPFNHIDYRQIELT